jgi:hypothetical protein
VRSAYTVAGLDEPDDYDDDAPSSSDDDLRPRAVPQEAPDTDSDIEPELSVEVSIVLDKLPSQLFSRPHATGHGRPPYELLDAMTSEEGRDRLIFVDYI